jgi:catechol 2,3-dioxygenase-like lactoylglutathione lyase family enzyme
MGVAPEPGGRGTVIGPIGIVTLRVEQWQAMLEFYRDRIGLRPAMVDEAHQYVLFDTGAVRFALEGPAHPAFPREPRSPAMMLNFQTDSIEAAAEGLAGRDVALRTPVRHGPGYSFVVFADPEGNEQIVYQRVKRA